MLGSSRAALLGSGVRLATELLGPDVGLGPTAELFWSSSLSGPRDGYATVDGSLAQATACWHSASGDTSASQLQIRFDRPTVVTAIDVWARELNDGIPTSWTIDYSDDHSTWTTAVSGSSSAIAPNVSGTNPASEPYSTHTTGETVPHQFWRIRTTSVNSNAFTIIGEIRVWGYETSGFTPLGQLRFDRYSFLHGAQGFNTTATNANRTFYSDTDSGYPSGVNQWSYSWWEIGPFTSGKYYFEAEADALGGSNTMPICIGDLSYLQRTGWNSNPGDSGVPGTSYRNDGTVFSSGTVSGGPAGTFSAGNIIGAAVDFDAEEVEYFVNNVSQGVYSFVSGAREKRWRISSADYQPGGRTKIHTTATYTAPSGYTFVGDL